MSRRFLRTLVAALLFGMPAGAMPAASAAAEPTLRAGAAITEITPQKLPVSMTGAFQDRQATSVHDPLNARCLVLDDGTTRIALLTADSCIISREIFEEAKRRAAKPSGIAADHMLMSATHTHTAATAMDLANCKADPAYVEHLTAKLAAAVVQAAANLQPAQLAFGTAPLANEVHNRRWKMKPGTIGPSPLAGAGAEVVPDQVQTNPGVASANLIEPAGPTDPDVMVLAVQTRDGRPLALYAIYALHYVGGIPADTLSADYFGEFAKQLETRLVKPATSKSNDVPFVAMLANGTSGDINNVDFRVKKPIAAPFAQIEHVAGLTADVAAGVYRTGVYRADVKLGAVERDLSLRVRKPAESELQDTAKFNATVAALDPKEQAKAMAQRSYVYRQEGLRLAEFPDEVRVKLQVLRVGELAIASIPCEPFAEIGLEIKRRSTQKPTFVVGLANGYHGYLPTPEQHRLGGYETWRSRWSYLEVNAATKITDALVEMLNAGPPK